MNLHKRAAAFLAGAATATAIRALWDHRRPLDADVTVDLQLHGDADEALVNEVWAAVQQVMEREHEPC